MDTSTEKIQEGARNRIRLAMQITGWTSTQLARASGIAPSTLNRFLNQEVKHTLSVPTMAKIDDAVSSYLKKITDKHEAAVKAQIYGISGSSSLEPVAADSITIDVKGAVQAGVWTSAYELREDEWTPVTLPRPDSHTQYFGLRVMGESMNLVYPEGTILVCVPMMEYDHSLIDGDHVIVQRWENGMVEATVKELRHDKDGQAWLWPRSDRPEFQAPLRLPKNGDWTNEAEPQNEILVTAVVVADYRTRHR
ncbi:XRE family transcriptional regulator [Oleispirillum naphthae]|uniref:LexA family protein n=1 Tax=Oleispirillum naphthae TaxID=2838853 RepID=UPI0030822079